MKIRVTIDEQSFEVEVGDLKARPIPVTVDGDTFMVWPEEQQAQAKSTAATNGNGNGSGGAPAAPSVPGAPAGVTGSKTVTAPIPGVIVSLAVKPGDAVSVGQDLCILEAMKMKNSIRANRSGKIAAVRVAPGDQVKRGQVMLEFSD